jgi:hypothetical protein
MPLLLDPLGGVKYAEGGSKRRISLRDGSGVSFQLAKSRARKLEA